MEAAKMTDVNEIIEKIRECNDEIGGYSEEGAQRLKDIENLLRNFNEENRKKALEIVTETFNQMTPYESYVPTSHKNFKFAKEWLEQTKV
jgi:dsDNA-specific endonuclease/ATPase MutS2